MVSTGPLQRLKPDCSRVLWSATFFWYNFLKGCPNIGGHFGWWAGNIYRCPLKQQIPNSQTMFLHLMLNINFLCLVSWEGNIKSSTLCFWKYPIVFWMRQPKISVQKVILVVSATKEEDNWSSCTSQRLNGSFLYKSTKWRTSSSRPNKNEGSWLCWPWKTTFMKPCWNVCSCLQQNKVLQIRR